MQFTQHPFRAVLSLSPLLLLAACPGEKTRDSVELVDSGTDGDPTDQDGDGYVNVSAGGTDCDDANPAVHPGLTEICDDGLDNDCDGAAAGCRREGLFELGAADALFEEEYAGLLGYSVAGVGDTNGDGYDDVLVGAPGWDEKGGSDSVGAASPSGRIRILTPTPTPILWWAWSRISWAPSREAPSTSSPVPSPASPT